MHCQRLHDITEFYSRTVDSNKLVVAVCQSILNKVRGGKISKKEDYEISKLESDLYKHTVGKCFKD